MVRRSGKKFCKENKDGNNNKKINAYSGYIFRYIL